MDRRYEIRKFISIPRTTRHGTLGGHDGRAPGWFEWVNQELLDYMFGEALDDTELAWEFMKLGVAPGQPFKVSMHFSCTEHQSLESLWPEVDEELDWEIIAVEPWPPEKVLAAWEQGLSREVPLTQVSWPRVRA